MLDCLASEGGGLMRVELACSKCGGNRFKYPLALENDAVITCEDCGHRVGTVAEVQHKLIEQLSNQRSN